MNEIVQRLIKLNKTVSCMESCTGGYICNEITNVSGSSLIFKFGAVTYSNLYKIKMGVDKDIIDKYSVYSINTAMEMSKCISEYTDSDYAIGVTGKLNKEDINNKRGLNNEVFISIYDKNINKFYNESIKVTLIGRSNNKREVFDKIVEMLDKIV